MCSSLCRDEMLQDACFHKSIPSDSSASLYLSRIPMKDFYSTEVMRHCLLKEEILGVLICTEAFPDVQKAISQHK